MQTTLSAGGIPNTKQQKEQKGATPVSSSGKQEMMQTS